MEAVGQRNFPGDTKTFGFKIILVTLVCLILIHDLRFIMQFTLTLSSNGEESEDAIYSFEAQETEGDSSQVRVTLMNFSSSIGLDPACQPFNVSAVLNARLPSTSTDEQLHEEEVLTDIILKDLNCSNHQEQNYLLNFFSSAVGSIYESFLPMYALHALEMHNSSVVEMMVEDPKSFVRSNLEGLFWLSQNFQQQNNGPSRLCIRSYSQDWSNRTKITSTWRFLEVPKIKAKYTYLGDVDIFFTETVLHRNRFKQMERFNITYSNAVRKNSRRLTGVFLAITDEFYTESFRNAQKTLNAEGNDEKVLYRLVKSAGHGFTPHLNTTKFIKLTNYRPIHGVHLSENRGPGKTMCLPNSTIFREMLDASSQIGEFLCRDQMMHMRLSKIWLEIQQQELRNMTEKPEGCV